MCKNVKDFGAVGDGTANDHPAIARAIAAVPSGGVVVFPSGNYRVNTTIDVPETVTLRGASRSATTISTSGRITAFDVAPGHNGVTLESMAITAPGAPRTRGTSGLKAIAPDLASGIGYLVIRDVDINGFDQALDLQYCQFGVTADCHLWANNTGYYQKRSVNMAIRNTICESNNSWGCFLNGDEGSQTQSCGTLSHNCQFVQNGSNGKGNVYVAFNEHFSLSCCMIDVPRTGSRFNIHVNRCSRGSITGCWIGAFQGRGYQAHGDG